MKYSWRGLDPPSLERLTVVRNNGVEARSEVEVGGETYSYEVVLDSWTFRSLQIASRRHRRLDLRRAADGTWYADETPRADLRDAVDIDLQLTPFTNTLPIRRLKLAVGESAEIVTAYVTAPSLQVIADPQRYTRLGHDRYLYESLDSEFSREIVVDQDGFVLDYPGLFVREAR